MNRIKCKLIGIDEAPEAKLGKCEWKHTISDWAPFYDGILACWLNVRTGEKRPYTGNDETPEDAKAISKEANMMQTNMPVIRECEIGTKPAFERALSELYVYYSANRSEARADFLLRAIRAYVDPKKDATNE